MFACRKENSHHDNALSKKALNHRRRYENFDGVSAAFAAVLMSREIKFFMGKFFNLILRRAKMCRIYYSQELELESSLLRVVLKHFRVMLPSISICLRVCFSSFQSFKHLSALMVLKCSGVLKLSMPSLSATHNRFRYVWSMSCRLATTECVRPNRIIMWFMACIRILKP